MNYNCCDGYKASSKITSGDGAPVKDCTSQDGDLYLDLKSRNMYIYTHGQWALLPDNRALGGSRVFITDINGKELNGGALIDMPAHDGNFISQPYDIVMRVDNTGIMFLEQDDRDNFKLLYYYTPQIAINDLTTLNQVSENVSIKDKDKNTRTTLGKLVDSVDDISSRKINALSPLKIEDDANVKGQQNLSLNLPSGIDMAVMKTLYITPQESPIDINVTMYSVLDRVAFFHKKGDFNGQGYPTTLYVKPLSSNVVITSGGGIGSMVEFMIGTTYPKGSTNLVIQCMGNRGILSTSSFMIFYNYDLRLNKLVATVMSDQTQWTKSAPRKGEDLQYPTMNDLPKQ
ncbi:MAG: hypothetical protein [Caudoviricetes sp.]|nr:MAG: hypothetical protein [Caudoviricetes sp.]